MSSHGDDITPGRHGSESGPGSVLLRVPLVEVGFAFMAIVLVVAPLASLLVTRETTRTQQELSERAEPLARSLGRTHIDTLVLANEATRFALTDGLTDRTRYDIAKTLLEQDAEQFQRLAEGGAFATDATEVLFLIEQLQTVTDAGVTASIEGNSDAVQQLLVADLPARLALFRTDVRELDAAVRAEIMQLRDSVENRTGVQRAVLLLGSLLGAAGLAVLLMLLGARRRLLRDTEQERARFDRMLEATGFGVLQLDARGRVAYVNSAAAEHLGYAHDSMLGLPLQRFFQWQSADGTPQTPPVIGAFRRNERHFGEDLLVRRDGSTLPVDIGIYPVDVEEGPVGGVVIFQNTTERQERQQRQDEFLALAAHELRTPLTSLLGYTRRLVRRRDQLDPDTAEAVETLLAQSERMHSTVEAFLDMARLEADVFRVEIEPVDLRDVVETEVEELLDRTPGADVVLEAPQSETVVHSDEMRLRQVLVNLLSNAVRHGGTPPKIRVRIEQRDREVVVSVTDNGAGIAPEDRPHIFERFYRRPGAQRREGLGVGLYLSRQIADRLGARLTFESEVGKGTTFELALPVRAPLFAQAPSGTRDRSLRPSV